MRPFWVAVPHKPTIGETMDDHDKFDSYNFNPHAPMSLDDFLSTDIDEKEVTTQLKFLRDSRANAVDYISNSIQEMQISISAARRLLQIVEVDSDAPELDYLQRMLKDADDFRDSRAKSSPK